MWGTASAAHQVEGGNFNSDWWEFEQQPGNISNGETSEVACDHYHRYREDFRQLVELGQNAHRLSVEWSRIEPEPGHFDPRAIEHYRDVLVAMRELGLEPMVTLHHFTSPIWFARRGGFTARGSAAAFLPFVRRVVDELGDLVQLWCTINEPNIYAIHGWLLGEFPPGRRGDLVGLYRVLAHLRQAHELAYLAIKERCPEAQVGLAHNKWIMEPIDPAARRHRLAAGVAQGVLDRWPVGRGRWGRVVESSCDFIGLNHYSGSLCGFDVRYPSEQFVHRFNPPDAPETDMGWTTVPGWLHRALVELRSLGKPIYVTENGIATQDHADQGQFLVEMLAEVGEAIGAGVDVRGYFYWTSMDNFEWSRGYYPCFGLISVDRDTLVRTPKPAAHLYAAIARANRLPDGDFEKAG